MTQLQLIATTSFGLEAVVSRELKALGYTEQKISDGAIHFTGDELAICRCNLWLRSADRVLLNMKTFEARDFDELFDNTRDLPWENWLPVDAEFPVRGKSIRSDLHSVPNCQAMVKKAVVERLKSKYQKKWFEESGPLFAIDFAIRNDVVTLSIDTTGPGLHKRGYRVFGSTSPLKETMAAALVQLSYWNPDRHFADPCCGSGTIPIEAALIGRNMAPGFKRQFSAEHWPAIEPKLWKEARAEALDLAKPKLPIPLMATDIDGRLLRSAREHAERAGVVDDLHIQQKDLNAFSSKHKFGCLITNPPYGERSGDVAYAEELYSQLGKVCQPLDTWSFYVITSHKEFEKFYRRRADRRRKLYNGRIECTYYQYYGPKPPWKQPKRSPESPPTTTE